MRMLSLYASQYCEHYVLLGLGHPGTEWNETDKKLTWAYTSGWHVPERYRDHLDADLRARLWA